MAIDVTTLTDSELTDVINAAVREVERRKILATASNQMAKIKNEYIAAVGRIAHAQWARPTTALGAYMKGEETTRNGVTYISTVDWNISEPGADGMPWTVKPTA